MDSYEVVIVGAGPAGSTCARLLAQAGVSVLLMDRDRFPRDKPCAGWLTPAVFQTLGIDPEAYRREHLLQDIRRFRTSAMYGDEVTTCYGQTVSYGIRRMEFDHFLLRQSQAPTALGKAVASLERSKDGWLVNGQIRARLLIGAGGHACPVARALGGQPGKEEAIAAMVAEFEMQPGDLAESPLIPGDVALSFTRDFKGYGWLLRKGNFINVGLGSLEKNDVRRQAEMFCRYLCRRGYLREDLCQQLKGHAYLPYRERGGRACVGERALLIGDAAGVSYPQSGEGILPAVETALLAAQTVLSAKGEYRQENLQPYADAISERFRGKGVDSGRVTEFAKRVGAVAILSNRWLTRRLVLDRWFLHTNDAPLPVEAACKAPSDEAVPLQPQACDKAG